MMAFCRIEYEFFGICCNRTENTETGHSQSVEMHGSLLAMLFGRESAVEKSGWIGDKKKPPVLSRRLSKC